MPLPLLVMMLLLRRDMQWLLVMMLLLRRDMQLPLVQKLLLEMPVTKPQLFPMMNHNLLFPSQLFLHNQLLLSLPMKDPLLPLQLLGEQFLHVNPYMQSRPRNGVRLLCSNASSRGISPNIPRSSCYCGLCSCHWQRRCNWGNCTFLLAGISGKNNSTTCTDTILDETIAHSCDIAAPSRPFPSADTSISAITVYRGAYTALRERAFS